MDEKLLKTLIKKGYIKKATQKDRETILKSLAYLLTKYREEDVVKVVKDFIERWYMYGQQEIRHEATFFLNGIIKDLAKYKTIDEINEQMALEKATKAVLSQDSDYYKTLIEHIITYAVINGDDPITDPKYKENIFEDGTSDEDYGIAYTIMVQNKHHYSAMVAFKKKAFENFKKEQDNE